MDVREYTHRVGRIIPTTPRHAHALLLIFMARVSFLSICPVFVPAQACEHVLKEHFAQFRTLLPEIAGGSRSSLGMAICVWASLIISTMCSVASSGGLCMAAPFNFLHGLSGFGDAVFHGPLGERCECIAGAGEAAVALLGAGGFQGGGVAAAYCADGVGLRTFHGFEHDRFGHAIPQVLARMQQIASFVCDRGHRFRLGGGAEGVGLFEVGDADEENVALLLTLERFHRVYVADKTFALRADVEVLEQGCRY